MNVKLWRAQRLPALLVLLPMSLSAPQASAQAPDSVDMLRLAEAFRLAAAVQDSVWPGGWGAVPFPVLLVTAEREYLVGYPRTPDGFTAGEPLPQLASLVRQRERQFPTNLLASFPAFGPPSVIVIGQPEATGKSSTEWVLTVVHERFHQYQTSDPDYYAAVERLDLSGGDQSGMWMLNYPFPYDSSRIAEAYAALSRELGRLLTRSSPAERRAFWQSYSRFLDGLAAKDRRYLGFQLWQEGVARYVELRAAEVAARMYEPTAAFIALSDVRPFPRVASELRSAVMDELANPDLAGRQRVSFYAFGAGLALLLDEDRPEWKERYLGEKFSLENYALER